MRVLGMFAVAVLAIGQVPSTFDNCPAAIQDVLQSLVSQHKLTGAQFAIAPNGVLTCAGAIGYADSTTKRELTPTSLMRIGSITKTITGMAIAKLFETGNLKLDDKAIDYVKDLQGVNGPRDARWRNVTILHLLQHSTGWDRAIGGEPIQNTVAIAQTLGIRAPATASDVIRWWLQQNLHFDPGTKASYTGVEYSLLALIVERASGLPFEQYVQQEILSPANVRTSMRVGRTLPEGRAFPNDPAYFETVYYNDLAPIASVFPYITGTVQHPYGEWYNEALEGSGGWTANAPALLRYVNKMFGRGATASLFKPETIQAIQARPSYEPSSATFWFGIGWQIIPAANGFTISFSGGLRGTIAYVRFLANGNSFAFITNTTSESDPDAANDITTQLNSKIGPLATSGSNLFATAKYTDATTRVPTIRAEKGVVQGASFEHGITVGSWFSIIGWNFANTTRLWGGADFTRGDILPTNLDGIEVKINGQSAAVYYISPTQINAQVPNLNVTGTAILQVFRDGVASQPEPVEIRPSSPEFFRYFAGTKAYVVATHGDGSVVADPAVVPGLKASAGGETIQMFGTGFVVAPAGTIVSSVVNVPNTTVRIGSANAPVSFSGLTATGLFQVNAAVPQLAPGDYQVSVTVSGVSNLITGTLSVR